MSETAATIHKARNLGAISIISAWMALSIVEGALAGFSIELATTCDVYISVTCTYAHIRQCISHICEILMASKNGSYINVLFCLRDSMGSLLHCCRPRGGDDIDRSLQGLRLPPLPWRAMQSMALACKDVSVLPWLMVGRLVLSVLWQVRPHFAMGYGGFFHERHPCTAVAGHHLRSTMRYDPHDRAMLPR